MRYQRESSAYDLSAFETRQSAVVKPNLQVVQQKQAKNSHISLSFSQVMFAALLLGMIAAILYSNAMINELGTEIADATKQYSVLQSDYKKLNADLESKVSLRNVEKIAVEELGLAKMEAYQIEYINMSAEDKIEVVQRGKSEKITDKLLGELGKFIATGNE